MTEFASSSRGLAALTASLSDAHPSVIRAINAKRRAMRLPEIITRGNVLAPPLRMVPTTTGTTPTVTHAKRGRDCKTAQTRWAGLKLSAAVAIGRARMHAPR